MTIRLLHLICEWFYIREEIFSGIKFLRFLRKPGKSFFFKLFTKLNWKINSRGVFRIMISQIKTSHIDENYVSKSLFFIRCFLMVVEVVKASDLIDHIYVVHTITKIKPWLDLFWKVQHRLQNLNPNNSSIGSQLWKLKPTKGKKGCQS